MHHSPGPPQGFHSPRPAMHGMQGMLHSPGPPVWSPNGPRPDPGGGFACPETLQLMHESAVSRLQSIATGGLGGHPAAHDQMQVRVMLR